MAALTPDTLSQLLGASWRSLAFPTLMVATKAGHNVVAHRRVDRDGVRVENTGQAGKIYTFKIPCVNTIVPGKNEAWQQPLYPFIYRALLTALDDRTSGTFVHPDFGQRNCKVAEWESTLDPAFRGGPTLAVTLWETVDDADAVALSATSTQPIAVTAAQTLDAMFLPLKPPPDTGTPGGISLFDFITSLGNLADEWDLMKMQWEASINRVTYQLTQLEEKFGDEPGFSDATERLISALHAIKAKALASSRSTRHYTVPAATTIPPLAARLGNTLPDLIKLNPSLVKSPIVQPTTLVRYYV